MAVQILNLNANEMRDHFRKMFDAYQRAEPGKRRDKNDFEGFHYVKWRNIETFYREDDWHAKARYLCLFQGKQLLGVNKVFIEDAALRYNNDYREYAGMPPIKGRVWGHAFIDVHANSRKQGVARALFDHMLGLMRPGDIFTSDIYSDSGQAFIVAWAKSNSSKIHLVHDYHLDDYDPSKVNFALHLAPDLFKVARRYLQAILHTV